MVYAENVSKKEKKTDQEIPILKNDEYYFGVYFPDKSRELMAGFDLWKFTTAITFVVIIFFGFALFVILRQKRLSEIQRDFINNVSHELKTPLATLSLASSTLEERSGGKEKKYVQIIQKEVARLQRNVEDILHSSVVDRKLLIERELVDLNSFLSDFIQELKQEYHDKDIIWRLNVTNTKPALISKELFENIVRNLIENAIKYGGTEIEIKCAETSRKIEVSVIDNGIGIQKEHQRKVFNKFYRVPEEKHQHNQKGFGLGLHIIKSEIKKMGGQIRLQSEFGKGSTFKIILPNG